MGDQSLIEKLMLRNAAKDRIRMYERLAEEEWAELLEKAFTYCGSSSRKLLELAHERAKELERDVTEE